MLASILRAPSQTKSIHLLRALLREATYLPDAVARQYFRRYIVSRFKAYQPKQNATASFAVQAVEKYRHRAFKRRHVSIITERASKLQKKAQKGLYYLRRANQGEIPCLQKALFFAYGRMGRRKYTLLADVLKPDPVLDGGAFRAASDFEGPAPLQGLYYSSMQSLQYFDAPKPGTKGNHVINISDRYSRLRAVLKSQYQKGISIHRDLKGPAMKTPALNVWMRPMPIKRARNNVRRWYAHTMDRFLPPLPASEWDNIRAMILKEKHVDLVKRRAQTTVPEPDPVHVERTILDAMRMDKLSKADRPAGMWRPHNITPKFMRRMYSRILRLCCKVEYNEERKHWVAIWGEAIQLIDPKIYHAPSDESLFAGVDTKGKSLQRPPPEPKESFDRDLQPRNNKGEYVRFPFYAEHLPESNPLRKDLEVWKRKRLEAGIIDEDGALRKR
ncbi:hypothetical protein CC86DRAFT_152462 [Ophiobolus disseminans]|uniref:LYR motif-containing protein Cup1-like N-terminal domain-containing protein n=1 Tax=Ophiobolus disseminans TaxID=1469910 RepID=A0A6A6ZF39_9PLEO|nr:hypothetical protein CC86DRAFT_152462 [Ophiobolus disseminans]